MINIVEDWHWWVIGTLMMVFNVFSKTKILIIIGVAAVIVGFILTVEPLFPVKHQLGVFLVLATMSIMASYYIFPPKELEKLNEGPGKEYIGKTYKLDVPMFEGNGTLNIDGKIWNIEGRDLPKGTVVRVVSCRGETLLVTDESTLQKYEAKKAQKNQD